MNDITGTEDEDRLVRRARQGDSQAFACLYHAHAQAVHALALHLTADRQAAEDITQEAFLRMFGFLSGLRPGVPVRPWLKRVASNLAIDHLRRNVRHVEDEEALALLSFSPDQATALDAEAMLRRFPPVIRTLIWLHEVEGWSHEELGKRFKRSPSWSKSMISRAMKRMRTSSIEGHGHE